MRKIVAVLGVIVLLVMLGLPVVSASYVCPAQYVGTTNDGYAFRDEHPSDSVYLSAYGEAFTANATCYLYNATFKVARYGAAVTTVEAVLYSVLGTVGSSAVPNAALATSYPLDVSTFELTPLLFTFEFDGTYELQNGTGYAIGLVAYEGDFQTGTYPLVYGRATNGDSNMNSFNYKSTGWNAVSSNDAYFVINGDTDEYVGPTPTPSPSPTPDSSSGDDLLEDWTDTIVTYLIPLLLILVPAFLGLKFLGSMGFFVGLNIGVIICYASGVSGIGLWTIILMAVVDLAYIFFNRR